MTKTILIEYTDGVETRILPDSEDERVDILSELILNDKFKSLVFLEND